MLKSSRIAHFAKTALTLLLLILVTSIGAVAATPAVLPQPGAPTVQATSNGGEISISWNRISGAQYYTVGWVNWTDGRPVSDAGGDWLSLFHYTTVLGSETSYTVKGLDGGDDYYAIIRTTDADDRFGGSYSQWSAWSSSPSQPAGQHGDGFCPITGLPLAEDGYLNVGDTAAFGRYTVTVSSIATPDLATFTWSDGTRYDREAPPGRRWLRIYMYLDNNEDFDITLTRGLDFFLDTNAGNAFSWSSERTVMSGDKRDTSLLFDIPQGTTTAVWAVRPYPVETGDNAPQLYSIPIPVTTSRRAFVFGELNWGSAQVQTRIAQYIVEKGYGYPTGVRFGATLSLIERLRSGNIDVLMELWLPNQDEAWSAGLAAGQVYSPGESLGKDWQSAFVIPAYLQEQYPELDSVEDLKDPQYRRLFAATGTEGKARLVSCVIGWACENTNAAQIEGYVLSDHIHIVNPRNGAALNADLFSAYRREEPWLGYQWGTNSPALLLDLVRLEEPAYSDECWETTMACAYEDATILIAANYDLPKKASDVAEMLRNWDFATDPVYKRIARWQDANSDADVTATALWWLNNHADTWEQWVTGEAATSIQTALAANERAAGWPN